MPLYEIVVRTGAVPAGGTNADVFIRLHGQFASTDWFEIDNPAENFEQGFEDVFTVSVAKDVGKLTALDIRHNNAGPKPGWFLEWVKVRHWQAKLEWHFPHNRWLAVDEGDRQLLHTLTPNSSWGTAIEPAPIGAPPEEAGFEIPATDVLDASVDLPDTAERVAVATQGPQRLDVLARGGDGVIWRSRWSDGWSGWESLGGSFTSGPAAVGRGPQRLDVVGRGLDNALWHRAWSQGAWTIWSSLGGQLTSDPDICSWAPGRLDVFARGGDQAVWHRGRQNTWFAWDTLGGTVTSAPAAVSWGVGRIDVVARGQDAAVWHCAWVQDHWTDWESLGGSIVLAPAICSWASNRLDIFARGDDGALWHRAWDNSWSAWESLGGILASSPGAVSWGPGHIAVVARGLDGSIWHLPYFQDTWGAWESLGSP